MILHKIMRKGSQNLASAFVGIILRAWILFQPEYSHENQRFLLSLRIACQAALHPNFAYTKCVFSSP